MSESNHEPEQKSLLASSDSNELQRTGINLSLSTLALEFEVSRDTMKRRLDAYGAKPATYKAGNAMFRLRDAIHSLITCDDNGNVDLNRLQPHARLSLAKAQLEELKLQEAAGQLVKREDHVGEVARILKIVAQELESLTDEIERDVGASPMVLEKIEDKINVIRQRMYDGIVAQPEHETAAETHS